MKVINRDPRLYIIGDLARTHLLPGAEFDDADLEAIPEKADRGGHERPAVVKSFRAWIRREAAMRPLRKNIEILEDEDAPVEAAATGPSPAQKAKLTRAENRANEAEEKANEAAVDAENDRARADAAEFALAEMQEAESERLVLEGEAADEAAEVSLGEGDREKD